MERLAAFYGEKEIRLYRSLCPPGINATRCLTVHSGMGADADHIVELTEFLTTLNETQFSQVAEAAFETAYIMAEELVTDASTTDAEIVARLTRNGITLENATMNRPLDMTSNVAAR